MLEFLKNEISLWEYLKSASRPIVIYGTGNGADAIISRLEQDGVNAADFFASDGFVRGQSFHGKTVKRLSDIEAEYGDFIILVAFGSQRSEVIEAIRSVAQRHEVLAPTVPVFGGNIFDGEFIEKNEQNILSALELFNEEKSRSIYKDIIKFQYSGKLEYLFGCESDKSEAYNNILKLSDNESYLDLGAYRGDTIDEFISFTKDYRQITALEPDPKTYKKLCEHCAGMNNCRTINAAVWSDDRDITLEKNGGRASCVSDKGVRISAVRVDSIGEGYNFSYIKADVEGCEQQAIDGAINTLRSQKPKLNIALYHRGEDIFSIPLKIKSIQPEYKFFIRHHPAVPAWDTNLYCI